MQSRNAPHVYQEALSVLVRTQRNPMSEREQLARWMIEHSFATGHGDTFEDLLKELSWQVEELQLTVRHLSETR